MEILLTGGTGFIGSSLVERLRESGALLTVLTRNPGHFDGPDLQYVSDLGEIDGGRYFDAFINLAGESMAEGRWSEARKAQLVESRVGTTRALYALAQRLDRPPAVVLSASAIGIYGHQGDDRLAENAPQEDGFAHRLCLAWEAEADRFTALGCRVCCLRLGVVFAPTGGAMEQMLQSFRFGIGTWVGSGKQWLSWVHRDDVLSAIEFLLQRDDLAGPFNLTAPEPVTHREFCHEVRVRRPVPLALPVPGFILRLALGEMAAELLLNGQRVVPRRLQEAGFDFRYPSLREAVPQLIQ